MKLRFLILVFFGVICICLIAFSWRRLIAPGKDEHIQQQRSPAYPGYNVDLQAAIKFVQANIILPSSQALTLANPKRSSFSQYGQDIIMNKVRHEQVFMNEILRGC